MAKEYVVKTTGTVNALGLLQDLKPVPLDHHNKAPAAVTKGQSYILTYMWSGNPGSTLSVTLDGAAGGPVVLVKSAKMPEGKTKHGRSISFKAP
mgnify:CR=1 FL=1